MHAEYRARPHRRAHHRAGASMHSRKALSRRARLRQQVSSRPWSERLPLVPSRLRAGPDRQLNHRQWRHHIVTPPLRYLYP